MENANPEKARRAYRPACRRCHMRKVKCDAAEGTPCANCRTAHLDCVLHEKRRRGGTVPRNRNLPSLRSKQDKEPTTANDDTQTWINETPTSSLPSPQRQPVYSHQTPSTSQDEAGRAAEALASLQEAGDTHVKRHLVEMLSQDDIDHRIMQKGVRVIYVGQEFSNVNYLIRHRARNEAVHHFPSNHISREYTSHELDRIPREAFMLPSPAIVDELLSQYFRHVNPGFPIIDEELFMSQYRGRDPQNPPSLLVLQAVLMVGAHVSRSRPDRDEMKAMFFRRAKMLFDARFEWNRDVVVQAALLLTWHSEGVEDVGANSYHWVGIAVRTAFGLGMHRDCGPSTLIAHDKRLWRRLWWILVQFDAMVAISYGRPLAINLDDADVPPLTKDDFKGAIISVDHDSETAGIDFVLHHTQLCCIMSTIMRERFGLKVSSERRKAALSKADQLLAEWQITLPPALRHGSAYRSTWSAMLHISYSNILILLHRPPPKPASISSGVKPDDVEICSLAGSSMIGLFETVWRRKELAYFNVFAVTALFTGMIQLSAEMRVSNPILAANAMRRFDTALEVLRSLAEYWLNAEIILRLFEESSERLQNDLRIGKATQKLSHHPSSNSLNDGVFHGSQHSGLDIAYATSSSLETAGLPTGLAPSWQRLFPQHDTASVTTAAGNESAMENMDWNHLYWDNSGFAGLSPFGNGGYSGFILSERQHNDI